MIHGNNSTSNIMLNSTVCSYIYNKTIDEKQHCSVSYNIIRHVSVFTSYISHHPTTPPPYYSLGGFSEYNKLFFLVDSVVSLSLSIFILFAFANCSFFFRAYSAAARLFFSLVFITINTLSANSECFLQQNYKRLKQHGTYHPCFRTFKIGVLLTCLVSNRNRKARNRGVWWLLVHLTSLKSILT